MTLQSYEDQAFEKIGYTGAKVNGKEFQNCTFIKCDLSSTEFFNNRFIDCTFENCNLSMVKLGGSTLNNMVCRDCKIMGVNFSECDDFLFHVKFEACTLDYSSFMGKKMVKTQFIKSSLKEVNFSQANLTGSIFKDCDLQAAIFNRTNLSAVNFASAVNYSIDPELNDIKKASFAMQGLPGLLTKYSIKIV